MTMSQEPNVLAVIPARYASTRFPGKPLVDIQGKPMVQHVWERVRQVAAIQRVIVATDHPSIQEAVLAFGGEVRQTDAAHPSGTDRVWEVARDFTEYDWILNVQGDEPFIDPQALTAVIEAMKGWDADIATLVTPIRDGREWGDPNIVKAVLAHSGQVLYFSRAGIPHPRDAEGVPPVAWRHLGLYLYRRAALERFTQLPPSPLEGIEKLEQLRALEDGLRIFAHAIPHAPVGIDTPEDLERLTQALTRA